ASIHLRMTHSFRRGSWPPLYVPEAPGAPARRVLRLLRSVHARKPPSLTWFTTAFAFPDASAVRGAEPTPRRDRRSRRSGEGASRRSNWRYTILVHLGQEAGMSDKQAGSPIDALLTRALAGEREAMAAFIFHY